MPLGDSINGVDPNGSPITTGATNMSNYMEYGSISFLPGAVVERFAPEQLSVAPAGDELSVARFWYDNVVNKYRFGRFNTETNGKEVKTLALDEDLEALKVSSATALENGLVALKAEILGGAGAAYDTLQELRDIDLTDQDAIIAALTTAVSDLKGGASSEYDTLKKVEDILKAKVAADSTANDNLTTLLKGVVTDVLSKTGQSFDYVTSYLNGKHFVYRATGALTVHTIAIPVSVANGGTDINAVVAPELNYTILGLNEDGSFETVVPSKVKFVPSVDAGSGKVKFTAELTFPSAKRVQFNLLNQHDYVVGLGSITWGADTLTGTVTPTVVA